ncbi:MAG: anion permease, partial [Chlorobi bacterium CHB2]|nr:anion permease [Chlorobi bacterium CHB2]
MDFDLFNGLTSGGQTFLLILCLLIALGFEVVNGFHDTANAVATVIYTRSLRPWVAVVWSGICNFFGVFLGGIAVALAIVHLLPVDLLITKGTGGGLAAVLALLVSAVLWNLGTWYKGLPASSSHTLIGAILGVGLANSLLPGHVFGDGVNWSKAEGVGLALLISPLIGFTLAGVLLWISKRTIRQPYLYDKPAEDTPPPFWIRSLLVLTCTGVSFAHGSNDGQKGVGLIMLVLIGILPAQYALNTAMTHDETERTLNAVRKLEQTFAAGVILEPA